MPILTALAVAAFICTIVSAIGKMPLWPAVLFLCLVHLLAGRI